MLDIKTFFISNLLSDIAIAIVLFFFWLRVRKSYAGIGYWTAAFTLYMLTILFVLLRGVIPETISILFGNPLTILGNIFLVTGTAVFFGTYNSIRKEIAVHWLLFAIFYAVVCYFTFVVPNMRMRLLAFMPALIIQFSHYLFVLRHRIPRQFIHLTNMTASIMLMGIVSSFGRLAILLMANSPHDARWVHSTIESLPLIVNQILAIVLVISLIMMTFRRQTMELAALNSELNSLKDTLEHSLEERTRSLSEAEKSATVGVLAAGIAHDILNPLNTTSAALSALSLGSLELWKQVASCSETCPIQNDLDPLIREFFDTLPDRTDRALDSCSRISRLCSDMMDLAKPEPQIQRTSVDLRMIITTAVSLCNKVIHESTNSFTMDLLPEPVEIEIDSFKIEQMLINLIVNACGSLQDRSQSLAVRLSAEPSVAQIIIEDQGCGIPSDLIDRVSEPFFSTSEEPTRYGLGLFIVHRIVQQHGGSIAIDSSAHGTTITIRIPR